MSLNMKFSPRTLEPEKHDWVGATNTSFLWVLPIIQFSEKMWIWELAVGKALAVFPWRIRYIVGIGHQKGCMLLYFRDFSLHGKVLHKFSGDGQYSAKSAYESLFHGTVIFSPYDKIWTIFFHMASGRWEVLDGWSVRTKRDATSILLPPLWPRRRKY